MSIQLNHNETRGIEATQLIVRQAQPDDAMDILRWRNDPLVCAMSRHHAPINEMAHMAWYSRAMDDPSRLLLIGVLEKKKIGFVRFDFRQASLWEVSITIAPESRSHGLGRHLLEIALKDLYSAHSSASVMAVVRLKNEPSLKLFRALGFNQESENGEFVNLVLSSDISLLDI